MQIIIIDLGSQYTLLIGRRLREMGVRSIILPPERVGSYLTRHKPKGIILSGGASSIYDTNSPKLPKSILELRVPTLGICLGMHWLTEAFGGEVRRKKSQGGYGPIKLSLTDYDPILFKGVPDESTAWASHGDVVRIVPPLFRTFARNKENGCIEVIKSEGERNLIWGLQFHPEVDETEYGRVILRNFLDICGAENDWSAKNVITEIQESTKEEVPQNAGCLLAYSGGVDSTVMAAILKPIMGEKLKLATLDGGQLREGEVAEIKKNAKSVKCEVQIATFPEAFWNMENLSDAEEKRKYFQESYFAYLDILARGCEFLIQGTLAPDIIESGAAGRSSRIKTHHNVGGKTSLKTIHPLKNLFKDEVRDLARALGFPKEVSERMPFPGPGLFCRIVGAPTTSKNLKILRWADFKVRKIIERSSSKEKISQLVVALVGTKTVGVKGDGRSYGYPIVVRAIRTSDFMTAWGVELPSEVRRRIIGVLTSRPEINRVWFDETSKPPATIELE